MYRCVEDVPSFSSPLTYFKFPKSSIISEHIVLYFSNCISYLNAITAVGLNERGQDRQKRLKKKEAMDAASHEGLLLDSYF